MKKIFISLLIVFVLIVSTVSAQNYVRSRSTYEGALSAWNDIREEFRATRADRDNLEAFQAAKDYLLAAADYLIAHMEHMQKQLTVSSVNPNTAMYFSNQMDTYIAELGSVKQEIAVAEDKRDIMAAAKTLRLASVEMHSIIKETGYIIIYGDLGNAVEYMQRLVAQTDEAIGALKVEGKNTVELDARQASLERALRQIRSNYEKAEHDYNELKGVRDKNARLRSIFGIMRSTTAQLKALEKDIETLNEKIRGASQ